MVKSQPNYVKIRTALELNPNIDLTSNGFMNQFRQKIYDYEEQFRELIIIPIIDEIGTDNWVIKFIEAPGDLPTHCDIYTDDSTDYSKVVNIVREKITDIEFRFSYKGNIDNYLNQ